MQIQTDKMAQIIAKKAHVPLVAVFKELPWQQLFTCSAIHYSNVVQLQMQPYVIRDHKANLLIVLTINFLYCALFIWGRDGRNKGPAKFHAKCAFTCYICLRSSPGSPQL